MTTMQQHLRCELALLVLLMLIATPALAVDTAVGIVTRVQEPARVDGRPVRTGDGVFPGNTITTGESGRVEVTFKDQTTLVVGGGSKFHIDRYSYAPDATAKEAAFTLFEGAFRAVTSAVVDTAPENFTVITPLATIGIRGTDFWGGYLSADELDVIMLQGKGVSVTTPGGTVLIDKPGFGVTVVDPDLPPQNLKQWGQAKVKRAVDTITFQ